MKKIELVNNKLNVELKPGDIILHKSKLGIAKYELFSIKLDTYFIKRIEVTRKNILYFTVSKFWFVKKGTETYLFGDEDIA